MNEFCKIEFLLKEKLEICKNDSLFANYVFIRDYLFQNIYPKIDSKFPDYTYHDGSHAINVLDNILLLLDDTINILSCETLYFLCLSTLFHDVGLIHENREEHQKRIGDIYNSIPGREDIHKYGNEKIIVTKTVEAHSGKAIDNTNDTLNYLGNFSGYSEMINTKEIAAILRFADELAEGGQRTSDYFIKNNLYPKNSKIFHRYSQAYRAIISTRENRLAITYNIIFSLNDAKELIIDQDIGLKEFLEFIYDRIIKIDDERKYCRYYCRWLDSMKEISIDFNFWYNDEHIEVELDPLIISDKIIPGDSGRQIEKLYPAYTYSNIINVLLKNLETKNGEKYNEK